MSKNIAIIGKYNQASLTIPCFGKVEILSIDDEQKTANASWQIFDKNKVGIAGITRSYYFGGVSNPQEEILKMILIDIQKYRINRQKVFSEIEVK